MKRLTAILISMMMLIISSGCTTSGGESSELAGKAVEQTLTYYKENKFDEFRKCLTNMPDSLDLPNSNKTQETIKAITNIEFNIKNINVSGDKATVDTEFTVLYLPDIFNQYISEFLNAQLSGELTEDMDQEAYANELFERLANDPDARRETRVVSINLEKSGDWLIVPDDDFVNILLGLQNE